MSDARTERLARDRDIEHAALLGRTVGGKYAITRLIGRGGMGAVFEAEHLDLGKKVALKFVDSDWAKDETVATRFAREARAASSIESDHIVSVFDAGSDGGRPYLVMELLRGEDLGTRLRRERMLSVAVAVHVIAQVLRGLAAAHHGGIVHRDLKPDNVFLIERAGDPCFAKIVDFGISKIEKPKTGTSPLALTQKGVVLGTPLYMSPEQAQAMRDVDGRADIFSVGAILFECLAGRPPQTGESYEQVIIAICIKDAPDLRALVPSTPDAIAQLVARALARDREGRFQSAADMLAALHAFAPDDPATRPLTDAELGGARASLTRTKSAPAVSGVYRPATSTAWSATESASEDDAAPSYRVPQRGPRLALALTGAFACAAGISITLGVLRFTRPAAVTPIESASTAAPAPSFAPPPTLTLTQGGGGAPPAPPPSGDAPSPLSTAGRAPAPLRPHAGPRASSSAPSARPVPKAPSLELQRDLP